VTQFQRSVFTYAAKSAGLSNLRAPRPCQRSALYARASGSMSQSTSRVCILDAGQTDERAVANPDWWPDVLDQIEALANPGQRPDFEEAWRPMRMFVLQSILLTINRGAASDGDPHERAPSRTFGFGRARATHAPLVEVGATGATWAKCRAAGGVCYGWPGEARQGSPVPKPPRKPAPKPWPLRQTSPKPRQEPWGKCKNHARNHAENR
jgi:hypothetical protein